MADQPYTEADVERATQAIFEVERANGLAIRPNEVHRRDAVAALDHLATAGRLLSEGAKTTEEWRFNLTNRPSGYRQSYPSGLGPSFPTDESTVRTLAEPYVEDPDFDVVFERRLTSATDWLPVDAALQARDQGSTDE